MQHWRANPLEFVQRTRMGWIGGGYTNLGHILREKESWRFVGPQTRSKSLPRSFSRAYAQIISVTPSLSGLVLVFYLTEKEQKSFDEILTAQHNTEERANSDYSTSILGPGHLKQEAIEDKRRGWRQDIGAWLSRNLPGSFVGFQAEHPCLEGAEFAFAPNSPVRTNVLNMCYPRLEWNAWVSNDPPVTLLMTTSTSFTEERWYGSLTVDRSIREKADLKGYGENSVEAFFARYDQACAFFAIRYGLNALLEAFRETAAMLRDESFRPIASLNRSHARRALRKYWQQLTDILNVSNDLRESVSYINQNCPKFSPARKLDNDKSLTDRLDEAARTQAELVVRQIETTSRIRSDLNNAYSMFETRSASRSMQLLTWANLLLATVALLAAAASAYFAWQSLPASTQRQILSQFHGEGTPTRK